MSAFSRPRGIEAWNATPRPLNSLDDMVPISDSSDVDSDGDLLIQRVAPASLSGVALPQVPKPTPVKRDVFFPILPTTMSLSEIAMSPLVLVRSYFTGVQLSLRNVSNFHTHCRTLLTIIETAIHMNFTMLPTIWSGLELL